MAEQLTQVRFGDDVLWAVEDRDRILVALRPICAALGLDWSAQRKRTMRDEVLAEGVALIAIPSVGGDQETVCLPLEFINGWLFGIDDRRVKPEVRARVLTYKRECYRVLYRHFNAERAGTAEDAMVLDLDPSEVRAWTALISECRVTWGRLAAQSLWRTLPLPQPAAVATGGDVVAFLAEEVVPDDSVLTPASVIYAAYVDWCARMGVAPVNQTVFGRAAGERLRKTRSGRVFYAARIRRGG